MKNWLDSVEDLVEKNRDETANWTAHPQWRDELRSCDPMVRRRLRELAKTYWKGTTWWNIRLERVGTGGYWGFANRVLNYVDQIRNQKGWRIRNKKDDECFEVMLACSKKGFQFHLTNDLVTEDTSDEALKEALCKMALLGPISLDEYHSYS